MFTIYCFISYSIHSTFIRFTMSAFVTTFMCISSRLVTVTTRGCGLWMAVGKMQLFNVIRIRTNRIVNRTAKTLGHR